MERRRAIKKLGLSMGAMMASPTVISLLQSCVTNPEKIWVPSFYSKEEGRFIRKLIGIILPASEGLPGAVDLNLHVFIDKYQREVLPVDEKGPHRTSLKLAMADLLNESGARQLSGANHSDYEQFLSKHLSGSYDEQQDMVDRIDDHLRGNDDDPSGLPEKLRIYRFLNDLRSLLIWAYQINEQIGENVMAYKPVPGEQRGCVGLQEATGGTAWALP